MFRSILFAASLFVPQQGSPVAGQPVPADVIVLDVLEADAKVAVYADFSLALVLLDGGRVLGPLHVAALPGLPGLEEATAGTILCVTEHLPDPDVGVTTYPQVFQATAPTLAQAVAMVKAQIQAAADAGALVTPCH